MNPPAEISPSTKLFLSELHRLFDEHEARWDRRFAEMDAAWDRRLVSRGSSVLTPTAASVSIRLTAPQPLSGQDATRGTSSFFSAPTQAAAIGVEVVADNWGGLFEQPAHIVEELVATDVLARPTHLVGFDPTVLQEIGVPTSEPSMRQIRIESVVVEETHQSRIVEPYFAPVATQASLGVESFAAMGAAADTAEPTWLEPPEPPDPTLLFLVPPPHAGKARRSRSAPADPPLVVFPADPSAHLVADTMPHFSARVFPTLQQPQLRTEEARWTKLETAAPPPVVVEPVGIDTTTPSKTCLPLPTNIDHIMGVPVTLATGLVLVLVDARLVFEKIPSRYSTTVHHVPYVNSPLLFGAISNHEASEVFEEMAKHNSEVLWPPPMHISNVFCTGSVPLVDKSIQSFFSPPSCHSWDAVPHRQPWPPPMQFELQSDGVQLRPMPWPSCCLIVWINAYFQYKCLIWILYCAISGNFWKHWYTCMFRDEVIWISFTWEGQCDLSFPHIPSLYDSADTHLLSTFVSLLACQQSDLYMLCAVDKLSNRLLQKFTTPIHAPAAVLTFKIKRSLLIQVLSSNSLVQGQHICCLTEIIGTSHEHGKLIELMSLGYFTWILTKNYLCVSDMCHSTKAGFLVKYLVPGVEFCPDNELSEMKTYIHILSVFDKDTHIQPRSWLLQHTDHILSASIKVKLLWSSPDMRMVLRLSQLVVCPCSICIFCDCILMGALGSISCPLVTCCRYKREEDILLRFQQQKRGNAATYLMCHLAHFASQNKDIQLLERINFALWPATNRMHLQYCDVGDFIWLALSGSSNGSNSYHSPSSRRNGVIFRTGKSLWLLQHHFYHLLIEDP